MMRSHPTIRSVRSSLKQTGVTLSEVLISMLIMSIGVVSLATLFPISVLRSIQASQLTNATLLSKNAGARLTFDSSLLNNTNIPLTSPYDPSNVERRLIDPFGAQTTYGLPNTVPTATPNVTRINGGVTSVLGAETLAMLPDSWTFVRQDNVTGGYIAGSHKLTAATAATNFSDITPRTLTGAGTTNPLYRLTILDDTGKLGLRRTLRQVLGNQLSWEDTSGPFEADLPTSFVPAKCRVEFRDNRYTWMMTVRKQATGADLINWIADVDLVVFFNRSFRVSDENSISVTPMTLASGGFDSEAGVAGIDDDGDGNSSASAASDRGWPGSDDRRSLIFTVDPAVTLKKGGFLFEPSAARWYRIQDVDTTNGRILVDRDLANPNDITSAVLMKGIVRVYELGSFGGNK